MFGRRYLLLLLTLTALSILYKWASARANLGYFQPLFGLLQLQLLELQVKLAVSHLPLFRIVDLLSWRPPVLDFRV